MGMSAGEIKVSEGDIMGAAERAGDKSEGGVRKLRAVYIV
jgi:hypothetical protein